MNDNSRSYEDFCKDSAPADWDGTHYHVRMPELFEQDPAEMHEMLAASAPSAASAADTYNWDTVFAVKFKDVNLGLAKPGVTPVNFKASDASTSGNIDGKFGAWTMSGGGDTLLHMNLKLASGELKYKDVSSGQEVTQKLDGANVTIEVILSALPQPNVVPNNKVSKTSTGGKNHNLVLDKNKTVTVTNVTDLPGSPTMMGTLLVNGLVSKWLNDNLSTFTYAFASVNLNAKADKQGYQWLKPTSVGYAVSQHAITDESVFGVLCMVDNNPAPATMQVSPNAIPGGQTSGFLISQQMFFKHLVMPGIHTLFDKAVESDFELTANGSMITNKKQVTMKMDGTDYSPKCDAGTVQITMPNFTEVQLKLAKAVVDFSPGITIVMEYTMFSKLVLGINSKGKQYINYEKAREPIVDHHVEVASWVTWSEVAASVAAALITLGAGAAAKQFIERMVIRVIAIIITLLVTELIANIAAIITAIAEGKKDDLPTIDLMTANATDPITWNDSGDFLVTSAGLNMSLQFGGDPKFL